MLKARSFSRSLWFLDCLTAFVPTRKQAFMDCVFDLCQGGQKMMLEVQQVCFRPRMTLG